MFLSVLKILGRLLAFLKTTYLIIVSLLGIYRTTWHPKIDNNKQILIEEYALICMLFRSTFRTAFSAYLLFFKCTLRFNDLAIYGTVQNLYFIVEILLESDFICFQTIFSILSHSNRYLALFSNDVTAFQSVSSSFL